MRLRAESLGHPSESPQPEPGSDEPSEVGGFMDAVFHDARQAKELMSNHPSSTENVSDKSKASGDVPEVE
jgi:hypothetical protein